MVWVGFFDMCGLDRCVDMLYYKKVMQIVINILVIWTLVGWSISGVILLIFGMMNFNIDFGTPIFNLAVFVGGPLVWIILKVAKINKTTPYDKDRVNW